MANEQALQCINVDASADLSSYQYRFMKIDTNGRAALATTGGLGFPLQNDPAALGRAAELGYSGISKVEIASVLTVGGYVTSDSNGRARDAASGEYRNGVAMAAGAASGDIVPIILDRNGVVA